MIQCTLGTSRQIAKNHKKEIPITYSVGGSDLLRTRTRFRHFRTPQHEVLHAEKSQFLLHYHTFPILRNRQSKNLEQFLTKYV